MRKIIVGMAAFLVLSSAAWTVAPAPPFDLPARAAQPYEQRLREQEAQQRRQLLTPPPKVETPTPGQGVPSPGGPCVSVREIRVQGATLLSPRIIRKLVGKYEGQCLNLDGINAVLQSPKWPLTPRPWAGCTPGGSF